VRDTANGYCGIAAKVETSNAPTATTFAVMTTQNTDPIDHPYHVEGVRPCNHSKIIELFFDGEGKLIVPGDAVEDVTPINFSNKADKRYQLAIKKGERVGRKLLQ
jgi:hypothetical protein